MARPSALESPVSLEALLDRLEEIRPVIERDSDEAERRGRLTHTIVESLKQAGFLRINLPRHYGGLELDPIAFFHLTEQISRIDAAVGWQVGVYNQITHMASARWPQEVTDRVFGEAPDTLLCGSLNSIGEAVPVDGGYRFTSQAPFNSGCHFADWCMMQGQVHRTSSAKDGPPELLSLACPIEDAEIVDNWDVVGMRGSGSNDVRVKDLYVPKEMTFPVEALGKPPENARYQGPLYRMPLCHHVPMAFVPVLGSLGVALDWVSDLVQNKIPVFEVSKLKNRSIAQINYGKALGRYKASYALIESSLEAVWTKVVAGQEITPEAKAELYLSAVQAMEMITDGIRLVASVAGTNSMRKGNPVERAVRDVESLRHHAYASEGRFGTVAQVYWGLEPDFGFISL